MGEIIKLITVLYPTEYPSDYIYTYPSLNDELRSLLGNSGYEEKFVKKYLNALRFLEKLKTRCVAQSKLFEKLSYGDSFYSMKLHGEKNIRILFDFQRLTDAGKDIVILYYCFEEKKSKQYKNEVDQAKPRRSECLKGVISCKAQS